MNLDDVALRRIPACRTRHLGGAIAGKLQAAHKVGFGKRLTYGNVGGSGIDARGGLVDVAGQMVIDHAAVGPPIEGDHSGDNQKHGEERAEQG